MATILSPTRIQLDWQDNSDNESHFVIEMHQGSGNWAERTNAWSNAVRSVITDLKPATEHFFRIKAVNPAHESAWSNVASATTPEFPPPAGLAATASSSDAVELVWEDHSAHETGFIVEYMESGPLWTVSDTLGANVTTAEVTGLQPETTYRFRVKAVEGTVSSAYSNIADVTTLQFLPAPANLTATVLTASSARLDWEDRSDGETGFAIEQRQGEGAWRNVAVAAADATGHVVDGLEADSDYLFRVRAVGNKAASSWSNEAGASTRVPPSVPRELTAKALSHREIELNWQRGSTNEEGYEIERRHGGGDWALVHTAGRGVVTLRDENLEERTTYTYRIRAHNVIGSSAWSAEASATTPATPVPGTPFGVTATATGSYSIRLNWVAPSPQYQSGFEIQESETGDETDFVRVVPDAQASATSYVRTGRNASTTYYYRIRAFNAGGSSSWTSVVSATTRDEDLRLPAVPQDVTATALGSGAIRIDWQLPSPSNEDGIEIERSVTGDTGDFEPLVPTLPAGTLTHTDDGLQARTTYHYRLRSYNQHGASEYSAVVGATTTSADLSAALRSAIAGKEALFPDLEGMLDGGSASMQVLRDIFGDYPRGYDESAARMLIAGWLADLPSDQDAAAQSMRRYVLFEEALRDAYSAPHRSPPLPGALDVARQTARPISVLVRDLCALGQSWAQQRVLRTHPYVDAAIEDMLRPVHDGVQTLLMLMGLNTDDDVLRFYAQILHDGEAPVALGAQALQSMNDYWQARILGRHYIAATQPLIGQYALRSGKLDAAGSDAEAEAQRDALLDRIDTETAGFAGSFAGYNAICTGLDAVYAITTAPVSDVPIFLRRMVQLRPRLVDGMTEGIAQAADPVTRALYLTASSAFADVKPLPVRLSAGGEAIFDATAGGVPPAPESPFFRLAATAQMHGSAIDAAEEDRNRLIALRSAVDAAQAEEIAREFDALRFGGRQMIGEIDRLLRPLFGVDPAGLYADAILSDDYNRVMSRAQQYKSRRTVLSVSMAEYVLTQNHTHRQNLLAEIDTLLGTLPLTLSSIDAMMQRMSSLIVRPVLLLDDAVLTADVAGGDNRFRLRLTVRNAGGSMADGAEAEVRLLAAGASVLGSGRHDFGAIPAGSQQSAVLDLEIPEGISVLPIAVVTRMTGGGSFVDERQLAVPHGTTGLEHPPTATSILYPNYPNPFTRSTNIRFSLAAEAAVRLSVHDLLGRELRTLVDARMPAGEHVYRFDAGGLPAGTYLCRLESLGRRSAAIMILYE